ncbi:MAG: hypothetical protein ACREID_09920, partial [Planctomycetota bacterium]
MRQPWFTIPVLWVLALPAAAVELVELKDGRVFEAAEVTVRGDRLVIRLDVWSRNQTAEFSVPFERVAPEFVYYAWAKGVADSDAAGHVELARWAREHGLFRHALRQYEAAAPHDPAVSASMEAVRKEMHEEEATWLFERAWQLFRENQTREAKAMGERIL